MGFRFLFFALGIGIAAGQTISKTGRAVPELASFEASIEQIMRKWQVPGAAVAITDQGRLIYARGFGFADRENGIPAQPTSQFRLASISKTMAGMTILKLAEEGKINLDARFMDLIPDLQPATNPPPDPRMRLVTVRQLLQHVGGFDRDVENDYVIYYNTASRLFNNAPVTNDLMTRYVISQRLDFDPGARYAYGNSGYQILGRIIERATGMPFLDAVRDRILRPAGAAGSIVLGRSLLEQRYPDEVKYYDYPGAPLTTTVVAPGATLPAPRPYNRRVELSDSFGGLVGNAIDLMRYINALEGRRGTAILNAASLQTITRRPAAPAAGNATGNYTGLTWRIIPVTGGAHWWHSGGASGTRNLLVRRQGTRNWVILTNTRPQDEDTIITDWFDAFAAAETQVRTWPSHDLYPDFAGPTIATSVESLSLAPGVPQEIQVNTTTPSSAPFAVEAPEAAWLKVDRLTGTTPARINVTAEPGTLAPGSYQTLLKISTPNAANGVRYLVVTLRVTAPGAISGIRNSASLLVTQSAAPLSRVTVDAEGVTGVKVVDSKNRSRDAVIVATTPRAADILLPGETEPGEAKLLVSIARGAGLEGRLNIEPVSPGLFTVSRDGKGVAQGTWKRIAEDGSESGGGALSTEEPIDLGTAETDVTEIRILMTGVRAETDPAAFAVRVGEKPCETLGIEVNEAEPGTEWIRIRLPRSLAGMGEVPVIVTVRGVASNPATVVVK
jgi:N-acyl-D-amino-acid deacylase